MEIEKIPQRIKELRTNVAVRTFDRLGIEKEMEQIKDLVTTTVLNEKEADGTPKCTNDICRKTEINKRLNENEKYKKLADLHLGILKEVEKDEIELEYVSNLQRAYETDIAKQQIR